MPPAFASSLLVVVLPRHSMIEPEPDEPAYWEEALAVVDAVPPRLPVQSESYQQFREKLIPKLASEPARTYANGAALRLYLLSFLDAPKERLGVPDNVRVPLAGIVYEMAVFFRQNPEVAQRALDNVIAALSTWELADRVGLAIQRLRLPFVAHYHGLGDGLLLVGVLADRESRLDYYETRLPADLQTLSAAEFNTKCRSVREDPHLVAALLRRFPPQLAIARGFERAIFGEHGHPESGRMALAFCCQHFIQLWTIMGWPRTWEIHCRLAQCTWQVKPDDLDELLTRGSA